MKYENPVICQDIHIYKFSVVPADFTLRSFLKLTYYFVESTLACSLAGKATGALLTKLSFLSKVSI